MASIQQSLNQLLGAAAGVATAGSYLYRQTPGYQAKIENRLAEEKAKRIETVAEGQAKIARMESVSDEDLTAWAKMANRALNKSPLSAIKLTPEEIIAGRESQLKPMLAGAESLEESTKEAYLASPSAERLEKYTTASLEAKKQRAEMEAFQRLKNDILSKEYAEYATQERRELLKQKDWQKNLSNNLNQPGNISADRVKLYKTTQDIRYKEKQKGEID